MFKIYWNKINVRSKNTLISYCGKNIADVPQSSPKKWRLAMKKIAGFSFSENVTTLLHNNRFYQGKDLTKKQICRREISLRQTERFKISSVTLVKIKCLKNCLSDVSALLQPSSR